MQAVTAPWFGSAVRVQLDPRRFRGRLWLAAVVMTLFLPVAVPLLCMYFVCKHLEEWQRTRSVSFGARQWAPWAHWSCRDLNEWPHEQARRCENAMAAAVEYTSFFSQSVLLRSTVHCVSFVSGVLATVLVVATLADPDILLHVSADGEHSLLWFAAVLSAVVAVCRTVDTTDGPRCVRSGEVTGALRRLAEHTHVLEDAWKNEDERHTVTVCKAVQKQFMYRLEAVLTEVAGVIAAPLILCAVGTDAVGFLQKTEELLEIHETCGPVSRHATFRHPSLCSIPFGGVAPSSHITQLKHGKLEKSILAFAETYGLNALPPAAAAVAKRVMAFKGVACAKMAAKGEPIPAKKNLCAWADDVRVLSAPSSAPHRVLALCVLNA